MNAVTKIKDDATKVELDKPGSPPSGSPSPLQSRITRGKRPSRQSRSAAVALLLMVALPLALAVGGGYFWVTGGRYQETENANLRQAKVTIASEAAGRIVQVERRRQRRWSRQGDVLFVIDPEPYRIALAQADAALAAARLNVEQLRAAYSQAVAQEQVAASEVDYVQSQFDRADRPVQEGHQRQVVAGRGAARSRQGARSSRAPRQQGIVSARAALGGNPDIETDKHPTVLAALAARDKAAYDLAQTTVRAPADGIVSQASSFKVGQFVGRRHAAVHAWSRPATPGSRRISRKRSSPT